MTGMALAGIIEGGVTIATVAFDVAATAMVAGAGLSIYSGYQASDAANTAANMQTTSAQMAANAQQMAANAQAQQLRDQADLAKLQANIEEKKAGVAQEQGEIEKAKRSRLLAYDIGNAYAQWAGNGLLVDGGNDSLGSLVTSNVREAGQDIGIIKSNTENAVWEHGMNKQMALLTAHSYLSQADMAETIGQANALGTLSQGAASAFQLRQEGLTAIYKGWGGALSNIGTLGMGAATSLGGFKLK